MRKSLVILVLSLVAAGTQPALAAECRPPAAAACDPPAQNSGAPVSIEVGKMLYDPSGGPIAAVYSRTRTGNPQIILDGRPVIVPAATLSMVGKHLTTSLSRPELRRMIKP